MKKNKLPKLIFLVITFLVFYQGHSINGFAQDVTDEDVEDSERRKKIAENEKTIAEAKKAELDAKFPKPDRSALVGGTTVNGDFIEAKMLGYCAMKSAASNISQQIKDKNFTTPTFIVYQEEDVKMLSRYQLMLYRLEILKQGYVNLCNTHGCTATGGVRVFGAGLVANKILDFLSLMKTDVDITGTEFDIGEKEIVAEVFNNLNSYVLYYPKRIPLTAASLLVNGALNSTLFGMIVDLGQEYDRARKVAATGEEEKKRLDALYFATMKELGLGEIPKLDCPKDDEPECPECKTCSQTTNVNVNVGDKEKEEGGGSGGGDKTFFSYLQAESLYNKLTIVENKKRKPNPNAYWLDLQVVKAGGNIRVKSNFITNFAIGARVNYSGGAIVYFNVFDSQGMSKLSGVVPFYEKYRKSSKITPTCQIRPKKEAMEDK